MSGYSGAALGTKLRDYRQYIGWHIKDVAADMGVPTWTARGRLASAALRVDTHGHGYVRETLSAYEVEDGISARLAAAPPTTPCFACGCRICSCRGALAA